MHVVLLKLTGNKALAAEWMEAHKAWLQQGFDDGVFLASGNLQGQPGGGILAHGVDVETLQHRLAQDPFVVHGVVTAEVMGIGLSRTDPRLNFLQEVAA